MMKQTARCEDWSVARSKNWSTVLFPGFSLSPEKKEPGKRLQQVIEQVMQRQVMDCDKI